MKRFTKVLYTSLLFVGLITITTSCEETKIPTSLLKDASNPVVRMQTDAGDIYIELYKKEAPITVENFLNYVNSNYYSNTIFHRVINGFMIQGGGFEPGLKQKKVKAPIKNEATNGLKNSRGTIAMARTSIVDSATSQFFINVKDNDFLNHSPRSYGYAVFGKVVEGMKVVDKIKAVPTKTVNRFNDVPAKDVIIKQVTVIKQ